MYRTLFAIDGIKIANTLGRSDYRNLRRPLFFELLLEKSTDGICYKEYNQWSGSLILTNLGEMIDSFDNVKIKKRYISEYWLKHNLKIDTIDNCNPHDSGFNISYSVIKHAWEHNRIVLKGYD
jgi:hypothetical protein